MNKKLNNYLVFKENKINIIYDYNINSIFSCDTSCK